MDKIIGQINNSNFFRNVFVMALGTTGAQMIALSLSPIITRLYGPEAFGIMGTFVALTQIVVTISALTYPIAIVLPKNEKNAKGLIKLSAYISLFIALLVSIFLLFFHNIIVNLFQIEEISSFLFLVPLVIIFSGIMQIMEQWLIRTNQFSVNAKANFLQSIATNGGIVGIGLIYPVSTVLVTLQAFGNGIRAAIMILLIKKVDRGKQKVLEQELTLIELAKKYKDFPLYRAPEVFISSIAQNLPLLLLAGFFGPAIAGFYNIGRTVLGLPSRLIGQAIGDVFYPRITEASNNGENLTELIKKATFILALVGIVPFGTIFLFGPYLFGFVFGEEWVTAGEYARWIAISSYSIFINKPSVRSMPVLNAQKFQLFYTCVSLITQTIALLIGFYIYNSDIVAVALFGISGAVMNSILILSTLKLSKKIDT